MLVVEWFSYLHNSSFLTNWFSYFHSLNFQVCSYSLTPSGCPIHNCKNTVGDTTQISTNKITEGTSPSHTLLSFGCNQPAMTRIKHRVVMMKSVINGSAYGSSAVTCSVSWDYCRYYAYHYFIHPCIEFCLYCRIEFHKYPIKTCLYFVGSWWSRSDAGYGFWTWGQGNFKPNIIGLVSIPCVFVCVGG